MENFKTLTKTITSEKWEHDRINLLKQKIERRDIIKGAGALLGGATLGVESANAQSAVPTQRMLPAARLYWMDAVFLSVNRVDLSVDTELRNMYWSKPITSGGHTLAALAWLDLRNLDVTQRGKFGLTLRETNAAGITVGNFTISRTTQSNTASPGTLAYGTSINTLPNVTKSKANDPSPSVFVTNNITWTFRNLSGSVSVIITFTEYDPAYGGAPSFTNGARALVVKNPVTLIDPTANSHRLLSASTPLFSVESPLSSWVHDQVRSYHDALNGLSYSNAISLPAGMPAVGSPIGRAIYPAQLNYNWQNSNGTMLRSKANKHLFNWVKDTATSYQQGNLSTKRQIGAALGNEMWRLSGGEDIMDRIDRLVEYVQADVLAVTNSAASAFQTWCNNTYARLTAANSTAAARNLEYYYDDSIATDKTDLWNAGFIVASNVQLKVDLTMPLFGLPVKGGLRFSFGFLNPCPIKREGKS